MPQVEKRVQKFDRDSQRCYNLLNFGLYYKPKISQRVSGVSHA